MKKTAMRVIPMLVAVMALLLAPVAPAAAHYTTPWCGIYWGSLAKSDMENVSYGELVNVRVGQHPCFDRIVFDVDGPITGYHVQYVDTVRQPGKGSVVPTEGGARLEVVVNAPAHTPEFEPVFGEEDLPSVVGFQTFRDLTWAGSFEGQTHVGLGVRARLPFRVFVLDGPGDGSRVVVDVAHYWYPPAR